ncbi:DUF3558 domain-containing protein [Actinokineospora sp.]|uniref:DUF3558 domain-containing protein n=1 Tax=Actinokineospora sp. TaxID=1872133 RepID=UPI004037BE65
MHPTHRIVAITAAMGIAATGCATTQAGTPIPSTTTTTTTTNGPQRYGTPPVTDPIDVTAFYPIPCHTLTPEQLPTLDLTPGRPRSLGKPTGSGCDWNHTTRNERIIFGFSLDGNGLANLYGIQQSNPWAYWVETTVEGYPAVYSGLRDDRARGTCEIGVGVSDEVSIFVALTDGPYDKVKSCERVTAVATALVKTLKEGV